ncbi:MAG TPA: spore germination protein GerW family protein [Candidatus Cloacimonadota bacterium]|nr:spore germination protein GerW family protein [Candidatus Cloacimonadota bacterium]
MNVKEMMQDILNKVENHLRLSIVFGEPMQVMDKTLIPVAKVAFGFGFGSGHGPNRRKKNEQTVEDTNETKENKPRGEGGGGGGGGKISPLGMFEFSNERTRFIPVITAKEIAGIIAVIFSFMLLMKHKK